MFAKLFHNSAVDTQLIHRSLNFLAFFRLALAVIIAWAAFGEIGASLEPEYKLFLAQSGALTYVMAAIAFALFQYRSWHPPDELARFSILTDIVIILLIMHCFGGLGSGLAVFLIFSVAIAGLLLPIQTALFLAALISLGVIIETILNINSGNANSTILQAGIYGIASFVTALAASLLGRWGREYQLLAERRHSDLAGLEQVNDLIIRRMRSGVLVVDSDFEIRQMNQSAWYLLGSPPSSERRLKVIAPPLLDRLVQWRNSGQSEEESLLLKSTQAAVVPQFVKLPGLGGEATLIFLEDTSVISRRARDLAQASLARLSASIAHEIRNPLGALSHASQLLGESSDLSKEDARMIEIIGNHTARMNDIVENVLKLSRRERATIEKVNISQWVRDLANEFRSQHDLPQVRLKVEAPKSEINVLVDPSQLGQAVTNLLENALRHAVKDDQPPSLILRLSPIRGQREMALDIIDDGPGIPIEKRSQIFEPFFTTHNQGSGLGLFLARQLCDANQAPLEYVEMPNAGACFRILLQRQDTMEDRIDPIRRVSFQSG